MESQTAFLPFSGSFMPELVRCFSFIRMLNEEGAPRLRVLIVGPRPVSPSSWNYIKSV
jgi:hypothetical protein